MRRSGLHTSSSFLRTRQVRFSLASFLFLVGLTVSISFVDASDPPQSRGARPIALGNGYTAVAGDAYSLYYNPAGLSELSQQEMLFDYGHFYGVNQPSGSDFNAVYAMPYRYKDLSVPLAFGLYGKSPASGAHIIEMTAGGGADAPVDRWTKGLIKLPVRLGAAGTIRQQAGASESNQVGKSSLGLSLTGGAYIPYTRKLQFGFSILRLALHDVDPDGPELHAGMAYLYDDYLNIVADLAYASGGVWSFEPGLEWMLARGVVRPRLGWGYRGTGGIDHVATGVGFYLSPYQVDLAYILPTQSLNDNSGEFRASVTYRFGRPQFSEIYYDKALEAASQLDKQVLALTVKEAELKASLAELEQKKRLANEEIVDRKLRIEELKKQDLLGERDTRIRQLQNRIQALEAELGEHRARARAAAEKKATIRKHVVKSGETLQSLANEYYGDPNQWKKIYNANTDKIERGLPKSGAELVIP